MNPVSPKKLLHSKWTAVKPVNKEKHWLVVDVICDDNDVPQRCMLEAVLSRRSMEKDWRVLKDGSLWRPGWV